MDNLNVKYDSVNQMVAIQGQDTDVYPYLVGLNQSDFKHDREDREKMCHYIYIYPAYVPPGPQTYHERPETLPFTRNDLEAFLDVGLKEFRGGYWSVYWASTAKLVGRDFIHSDGYRPVVSFRTIEFSIRPMPDYKSRADGLQEPKRLYIGRLDVEECLTKALGADRPGPLRTLMGVAHTKHPGRDKYKDEVLGKAEITFEWRIDRVLPEKMDTIVQNWRTDAFENTAKYHAKAKEFNQELQARDPATTQPGAFQGQVPPDQHRGKSRRHKNKRSSREMTASQDLSPDSKRRVLASQSGSVSQPGLAPQPLTASPEMARQAPGGGWPQSTMAPPPPQNPQNPQYAQQGMAYAYPGYGQNIPAPSPGMSQPQPQMAVQQHAPARGSHRRHKGAGSAHAQPGGGSADYWGQNAPAQGQYAPGTGNYYPTGAPGAAPAMAEYQGTAAGSGSGGSYPSAPSFSSPAMAPPGTNVVSSQAPSSGSEYQGAPMGPQPGWWDEAGWHMHSSQPHGGDQSGYQGQYRGGRGSGQR